MQLSSNPPDAEVFISYSSRDRDRVLEVARHLESSGVRLWVDSHRIGGGGSYGPEIVQAIKACKVVALMCSDASLRSRNVKQEIQLAWKYNRPYVPLLLEPTSFGEQIEYWLEGWQWIEVLNSPSDQWLPAVLRALARAGVNSHDDRLNAAEAASVVQPIPLGQSLESLRSVARFTDRIWPIPAEQRSRSVARSAIRGLGAPQVDVQHGHRLGNRVCLAIESDCAGHLLLLDEGPEGVIYCLCPSWFAPETRLQAGRSYLPEVGSRYDAFVVTGRPGREHLLAIVSDEQLGVDLMTNDPVKEPARVLKEADIETMLVRLRSLSPDRWAALSTYFDVIA